MKRPSTTPKSARRSAARAQRREAQAHEAPTATALLEPETDEHEIIAEFRRALAEHGTLELVDPETAEVDGLISLPDAELASTEEAAVEAPETLATDVVAPERDERPDPNPSPAAPEVTQATNASLVRWEGILLVEDHLTDDGRYIAPGATSWRELPLTLLAMIETSEGGHVGAQVCGRIDEIWREGNLIMGRGVFDEGEFGQEIARMVDERVLRGNSVDLAVRAFEIAYRDEFDESGHRVERPEGEGEEPDLLEVLFGEADSVFVFTDCIIGASTVCPFPAFADAAISVTASATRWTATRQAAFVIVREPLDGDAALTASAIAIAPEEYSARVTLDDLTASAAGLAPVVPPAEWFENPEFDEPTPLTITDDGRVFGHAAVWDTCHLGIPDVCTTAPSSLSNYAYFLLGEVEVDTGETVSVGKITLGTGHAAKHLGRAAAAEHYDNTGSAVADVTAGEDEHGIWIAGALRPDVPSGRVREFRASTLSGDWRNVNGHLELVGILAVNVPGFPVLRPRAAVVASADEDNVRVLSLVAAGIYEASVDLTEAEKNKLAALHAAAHGGLDALAELALDEAA